MLGRTDPPVRPNIIILVADDRGCGDVSYHSDQILTPNIDTLSDNSILLNNYYTSPVNGIWVSIGTSLPRPTGALGYWSGSGDHYEHTALEDKRFWGLDFRNNMDLITNPTGIYSTHYFTDRSTVHASLSYDRLQAPQKSIGQIVRALNDRQILTNSIVVFVSDNGGAVNGFRGNAASNWPLRGVKATLWEGGIRVPAFIWSPLLNKTGYVYQALIHVSDVMPIILETIGDHVLEIAIKTKTPIYGQSQWKTLSYDRPSPRSELVHNVDPIAGDQPKQVSHRDLKQWIQHVIPCYMTTLEVVGGIGTTHHYERGTGFSEGQTEPPVRPNIIILVADDLGWGDVGYHSDQMLTPNIDTLAANGILLNNYYTSPVCSPSRGALLTSVHPIHSGLQNYVILTASPWGMPLDIKTLPQYLKSYDYSTHAIGKWHLGFYRHEFTPTYRGFDSHVGYWSGSGDYYDHTALEDRHFWGLDFRHNMDLITNATGIYSTNYFTDRCLQVISDHNTSQPLFLYVAYQAVHGANNYARLQAPQKYIDMFTHIKSMDRRIFAAMAYAMDESIGQVVRALNDRQMLANSIVVFVSDNGGPASGFTGNAASNWPLRGVKATLWEGGIRVPAFIWSPLLNKTGYVSQALIHVSDVMPTILEAIGAHDLENRSQNKTTKTPIYGQSQWKTLSYDRPSPRSELVHNVDPIWNVSAIRSGDWKLIQGLVFPDWSEWYPPFGGVPDLDNDGTYHSNFQSLRNLHRFSCLSYQVLKDMDRHPDYDILRDGILDCGVKPVNASTNCRPDIDLCLYDVKADPCEYHNVADKYPEVVKELWHKLLAINQTAVTPGTKPSDSTCDPVLHDYAWSCWRDD
ncbi:unnamed protein product [Oppiella nova]|uniref:Sulfatase N-terminal domain-containing protein n=1 Tax=Oppiella nova TaxID=334625 RepID=A0A7R9LEZ8_9ACAR|nr:unnamed protein product [Oppiella nova]CAG2162866.1 unnamed protein product [Oppiella nova]